MICLRMPAPDHSPTLSEATPSDAATLWMGPAASVGAMAPGDLVEMFKRAMAPDIARLETRLDHGDA